MRFEYHARISLTLIGYNLSCLANKVLRRRARVVPPETVSESVIEYVHVFEHALLTTNSRALLHVLVVRDRPGIQGYYMYSRLYGTRCGIVRTRCIHVLSRSLRLSPRRCAETHMYPEGLVTIPYLHSPPVGICLLHGAPSHVSWRRCIYMRTKYTVPVMIKLNTIEPEPPLPPLMSELEKRSTRKKRGKGRKKGVKKFKRVN